MTEMVPRRVPTLRIETERGDINRTIAEMNRQLEQVNQLASEIAALETEIAREEEWSRVSSLFPTAQPSEPEPQSWEVMQAAAQRNFDGDITRDFVQDIIEHGEIAESGLGRRWYDRTLTMFENLYYDAVDLYHDTMEQARDFWQRATGYGGREPSNEPERDRDEPEMDMW